MDKFVKLVLKSCINTVCLYKKLFERKRVRSEKPQQEHYLKSNRNHLNWSEFLYNVVKSNPRLSSHACVLTSSIQVAGLQPSGIRGTPGMDFVDNTLWTYDYINVKKNQMQTSSKIKILFPYNPCLWIFFQKNWLCRRALTSITWSFLHTFLWGKVFNQKH